MYARLSTLQKVGLYEYERFIFRKYLHSFKFVVSFFKQLLNEYESKTVLLFFKQNPKFEALFYHNVKNPK